MVLRSRFHLCDANIFGGARAARNGGARGTGVRGALLEAVGVADTAAHGLFWEPREVSCFFACAAGASRGAPKKTSTAPRRLVCGHSRCDSFRRAILGRWGAQISLPSSATAPRSSTNGFDQRGVWRPLRYLFATGALFNAPVDERADVWPISSGSSSAAGPKHKTRWGSRRGGRRGRQPTTAKLPQPHEQHLHT